MLYRSCDRGPRFAAASPHTRWGILMHVRSRTTLTRRLMEHLRAPLAGVPAIVPALRAYSGLRFSHRNVSPTSDILGRPGTPQGPPPQTPAAVPRAQHPPLPRSPRALLAP